MENWKKIERNYGYNYEVSTYGRVAKKLPDGTRKILKLLDGNKVALKTLMKAYSRVKIDKLVCNTFIDRIIGLNGSTVIHKDGNESNNCVDNLEWSKPVSKKYLRKENYKIYAHIAPNGKYYIGQTKLSILDRWRQGGKGYKKCVVFYNAIKKIWLGKF